MRLLLGLTVAYIALGASAVNPLGENKVLGLVEYPGAPQTSVKNIQQTDDHPHHSGVQRNSYSQSNTDQPERLVSGIMKRRLMRRAKASGPPKGSVIAAVTQTKVANLDMSQKGTADPAKNKSAPGGTNELLGKKAVDVVTPSASSKTQSGAPDPLINVAPGDHAITKITTPQLQEGLVTTGNQQPPKQA